MSKTFSRVYGHEYRYGRRLSRFEAWAEAFFSYDGRVPWWRRMLAWLTQR